jgi:hypothetical protein
MFKYLPVTSLHITFFSFTPVQFLLHGCTMRLLPIYHLAQENAKELNLSVREYLWDNRDIFLTTLLLHNLYFSNCKNEVETIVADSITIPGASQILIHTGTRRKTVSMHYLDTDRPLAHPTLPCITVRRSRNHYDYFPLEYIFYVTA